MSELNQDTPNLLRLIYLGHEQEYIKRLEEVKQNFSSVVLFNVPNKAIKLAL
ncbi:hypothetical protein SPHINGO8BC_51773 [Sphingobacterium multivorum]|uniref:Uncharacterized protein n=1 Tax=Sphingobacterium multivorum TaxID=28454 RepID=A0A654D988_SPHMU|nr:hypothetical protein SPHINGO8BC_51773 [Sphingobacterium multivorum]